jgi:hypothetical protein
MAGASKTCGSINKPRATRTAEESDIARALGCAAENRRHHRGETLEIETLVGLDQLNEVEEQTVEDKKWE